jgi:flagellin-specific chaperone FliS
MCKNADVARCLLLLMQMESQLGSPEAALRVVATAVCAAGSKSCTHVHVLLERYSHLLQQLMQAMGQEQGESLLLEVLGHMYSQMPTRLHLALSR